MRSIPGMMVMVAEIARLVELEVDEARGVVDIMMC